MKLVVRNIFKCGDSSVVSLPSQYLAHMGLKEGDRVVIELDKDCLKLYDIKTYFQLKLSEDAESKIKRG